MWAHSVAMVLLHVRVWGGWLYYSALELKHYAFVDSVCE